MRFLTAPGSSTLILTPLPLSGGAVFAGKISLLVAFLGLFVIDGNLFGTLLVPAIAGGRSGSAVLVAHITVSPIRSPLIEYLTRNACLFSIQTLFR